MVYVHAHRYRNGVRLMLIAEQIEEKILEREILAKFEIDDCPKH